MGANTNNTYFRNHKFIIADILTLQLIEFHIK